MTDPDDPYFPAGGNSGATIREAFAALALQGVLAGYDVEGVDMPGSAKAARLAVGYADALILALNAPKETK
jgi:hypothetical protein